MLLRRVVFFNSSTITLHSSNLLIGVVFFNSSTITLHQNKDSYFSTLFLYWFPRISIPVVFWPILVGISTQTNSQSSGCLSTVDTIDIFYCLNGVGLVFWQSKVVSRSKKRICVVFYTVYAVYRALTSFQIIIRNRFSFKSKFTPSFIHFGLLTMANRPLFVFYSICKPC